MAQTVKTLKSKNQSLSHTGHILSAQELRLASDYHTWQHRSWTVSVPAESAIEWCCHVTFSNGAVDLTSLTLT